MQISNQMLIMLIVAVVAFMAMKKMHAQQSAQQTLAAERLGQVGKVVKGGIGVVKTGIDTYNYYKSDDAQNKIKKFKERESFVDWLLSGGPFQ